MKIVLIILAVLACSLLLIIGIGSTLPETEASRAHSHCYTLNKMAYTHAEKVQAEEVCAVLRKEADRRMGRLPAGTP